MIDAMITITKNNVPLSVKEYFTSTKHNDIDAFLLSGHLYINALNKYYFSYFAKYHNAKDIFEFVNGKIEHNQNKYSVEVTSGNIVSIYYHIISYRNIELMISETLTDVGNKANPIVSFQSLTNDFSFLITMFKNLFLKIMLNHNDILVAENNLLKAIANIDYYESFYALDDINKRKNEANYAPRIFESIIKKIQIKKQTPPTPQQAITAPENTTPINPHPTYFINVYAYQLFEALRLKLVNDKTKYADYSFIHTQMAKNNYLINNAHLHFIKFLDKNYGTNFNTGLNETNYKQFKEGSTVAKNNTYTRLNNEFKALINSVV